MSAPHYICPEAAKKKLTAAMRMGMPVYLYGATGCGKTALVQHLFAAKKYEYVSAAELRPDTDGLDDEENTELQTGQIIVETTGQSTEQIIRQIRGEAWEHRKQTRTNYGAGAGGRYEKGGQGGKNGRRIVVIDDLHTISTDNLREFYAAGIRELLRQKQVQLVLISRSPIPGWLLPLRMQYMFAVIAEEDFYLTREQQEEYLAFWDIRLDQAAADGVWEEAHGQPLALYFLAMEGGDRERSRRGFWQYLETHIYDQWDVELQEFLMEISIVDTFDTELAAMITGSSCSAELIRRAEETGNFFIQTGEEGVWGCQPVMRDSMRRRLERKRTQEQIARLYRNAGLYYELHDRMPMALEMYHRIKDMDGISRILTGNARKNPASGDYYAMRRFYLALPEDYIRRTPELMSGMSMLQSLLMNREESERWYRELSQYEAEASGSSRREAKMWLLYLDIALPHRGSRQMLALIRRTATLMRDQKIVLPEPCVTSNLPSLMNGGKDFCEWSRHDRELAAGVGQAAKLVSGKYGKGLVPLALAESLLEKGEDNYEVITLAEKGRMQADSVGKIEMSFVANGLLAWLHILHGKEEDAGALLATFEKRAAVENPRLLPNIRAFWIRIRLYGGDTAAVKEWLKEAPDENQEFCTMERFRYLTKVRVYLAQGKYPESYRLLQQIRYYAEKMQRTYIQMEVQLLLAVTQARMGDETWKTTLQDCVTKAESYHFVRLFSREGAAAAALLREKGLLWQDEDYKQQVLRECRQMELQYPHYLMPCGEGDVSLGEKALQILHLQAEGHSTETIAGMLNITAATVKYHNRETYRKLGVKNKAAAVAEAKKRKLI